MMRTNEIPEVNRVGPRFVGKRLLSSQSENAGVCSFVEVKTQGLESGEQRFQRGDSPFALRSKEDACRAGDPQAHRSGVLARRAVVDEQERTRVLTRQGDD